MTIKDKAAYNEYMRVYMVERYHRRRAEYLEKLGGRCVDCGQAENLEFDHDDPATKSFDVGKAISGWSKSRLDAEMLKCVLRCKAHHKAKSDSELSVEHGGGVSGKKNCPCAPCKAQKAVYMKNYIRLRS